MTRSKSVPGKRETAAAAQRAEALVKALMLGHAGASDPPPFSHFRGLATELRISEASFDAASGMLEVRGWCLTPQPAFRLFIEVRAAGLVAPVVPGTEKRKDIQDRYPQYGSAQAGWSLRIPVEALPADATVQVVYFGEGRHQTFQTRILQRNAPSAQAAAAEALAASDAVPAAEVPPEVLEVESALYSPARNLCTIEGTLATAREAVRVEAALASGGRTGPQGFRIAPPDGSGGARRWRLNFAMAGMIDREEVIVSVAGRAGADQSGIGQSGTSLRMAITDLADSPRRIRAVTAAAPAAPAPLAQQLGLEDLAILAELPDSAGTAAKARGEVCYFPPFEALAELSDHVHRARWYLGGSGSPVQRATFHSPFAPAEILAPAGHMMDPPERDSPVRLVQDRRAYLEALQRAEAVLVWRPVPETIAGLLAEGLGKPLVLRVATEDPSAREYRNYARLPWLLLSGEDRAALLQQGRARFRDALEDQRRQGKTCSAVLGAGPSLDRAFDFDFGGCMTVACNSIVASPALLDHVRPAFLCAGDAVSHFGVSRYAQAFRADLARALLERGILLLTTAEVGFQLVLNCPEIRDRVILCEQGFSGLNADLGAVWSLPRLDSTLNIHMLPVAASFGDTVFMLGLDGRSPDPAQNEDFWAHSGAAQYHDLVATAHLAHPSFAGHREGLTEERYLASVEDSLLAGEAIGKRFYTLADSFTPAVRARPVPEACLAAGGTGPRRRLRAPGAASAGPAGRRILVVARLDPGTPSCRDYHAMVLADALAGDEVVLWTTGAPAWLAACGLLPPDRTGLRIQANDFIEAPGGRFEQVVIMPEGLEAETLVAALGKARACNARVLLVSFAPPNLVNARSAALVLPQDAGPAFATACFADIVVSASATAGRFAERHFRTLFHRPRFLAAPLAVNAAVADRVLALGPVRARQVLVLPSAADPLAADAIALLRDLALPAMAGGTIALALRGGAEPEAAALGLLRDHLGAFGIGLRTVRTTPDAVRFEEIARSEMVVLAGLDEETGLAAAEAGWMGTPCVAYDQPVLRESAGRHLHLVPFGAAAALRDRIAGLLERPLDERLQGLPPCRTADPEGLHAALRGALAELPGLPAVRSFSPEKFALALGACPGLEPPGWGHPDWQGLMAPGDSGRAGLEGLLDRIAAGRAALEEMIAALVGLAVPPTQDKAG